MMMTVVEPQRTPKHSLLASRLEPQIAVLLCEALQAPTVLLDWGRVEKSLHRGTGDRRGG